MQVNVPTNTLPIVLDEPNRLSLTYTTNVLYPKLGPLTVNRYVRIIASLLRDYAAVIDLVGRAQDYKNDFNKQVVVVPEPRPWEKKNVVKYKPDVINENPYLSVFIANPALAEYRKTRVNVEKAAIRKLQQPLSREAERGMHSDVLLIRRTGGSSNVVAVDNVNLGDLVDLVDQGLESGSDNQETLKKKYLTGSILHSISQVNAVIPDLISLGIINTKGNLICDDIIECDRPLEKISEALSTVVSGTDDERLKAVGALVDQAFNYLEALGLYNNEFICAYRRSKAANSDSLWNQVNRYVIDKIDKAKPIEDHLLPLPDDSTILNSREWAFQRVERLDLILGQPVLRGPFNAEAVSPNSELTIAESFTAENLDLLERVVGQAEQQTNERGIFTSGRFRSALSNMTESGITKEQVFGTQSQQEVVLLNTLREQRRETIDRTLVSISRENEERTISTSRAITSTSRSYTTRGKDPVFSTTELSFQVAVPVTVQVTLEDINLVWAPRVASPFLRLHNVIRNIESNSRFEYVEQNLIVDPVSPAEEYEKQTISEQLAIKGKHNYQSKIFDFPIDAKFSTGDWKLDAASSTIDFRNGTGDDYDWKEQWNWDDLENWSTYFKSIYQDGDRIRGEAVLETTDPECFNRGFLTFNFVMKQLTERSRAELRAYAAEKASTEAERRAVYSRARQYARLRRDEIINYYQASLDLREEAFATLIDQVFQGIPSEHCSYYKEIIRSAINWSDATLHFEANLATNLPYPEFSRSHFMNASGVRFILPIIRGAEDAFFEAVSKNGSNYHTSSSKMVRRYTKSYRDSVEKLKESPQTPSKLVLDSYTRDIVIGRHLEAVLSNHPFANMREG